MIRYIYVGHTLCIRLIRYVYVMYTLCIRPTHNISDFLEARVDVCQRIGTFPNKIIMYVRKTLKPYFVVCQWKSEILYQGRS